MYIKIFFITAFVFILISLGFALFNLVKHKDPEHSTKTAKALTYRICISLALFIMLFIAYATGMIKPQGIGARINQLQHDKIQQNK
ncbi:MAG: twin transmembrane helix small protein [Methylococcales bacterium]|jgi:F0F1-type ATP synthase membrane subunit a|nr:twin transmembrane helix small protein [Methylococcaceae bacterium]